MTATAVAASKVELGDFQTPPELARELVAWVKASGVNPDVVIEPTCGVGAFLVASGDAFPHARLHGYELQADHVRAAVAATQQFDARCDITQADFFAGEWSQSLGLDRHALIIGNPPWVTNAVVGSLGGTNVPVKSNFQGMSGWEARTGAANFDISEWMLVETLCACRGSRNVVAMICKRSVARKMIGHVEKADLDIASIDIVAIDAKAHFGASVDACFAVFTFGRGAVQIREFADVAATATSTMGRRSGLLVRDLAAFEASEDLLGGSSCRWRSGLKHDAAKVLEVHLEGDRLVNGLGHVVEIEDEHLFPLMKGTAVSRGNGWDGNRFVVVPNRSVGQDTSLHEIASPKLWAYLARHAPEMAARKSSIYRKQPPFTIFGVGDYAFRPVRVAISSLHKRLDFQLVEPSDGKPVQFDDTVYYASFESMDEATRFWERVQDNRYRSLLDSLIFWDDKRPIKAKLLNSIGW